MSSVCDLYPEDSKIVLRHDTKAYDDKTMTCSVTTFMDILNPSCDLELKHSNEIQFVHKTL